MGTEWLEAAKQTLANHRIELYEIPSANPGVTGYPGASPKQLSVQAAFFSRRYRIVSADGANQSGKTQAIGGLCFAKHLRDHAKNADVYWCIAQSHDTLRDIPHKTIWYFLPRAMFPDGLEYSPRMGFGQIPTLQLTLPGGRGQCELWFKTEEMDLKSFESARLNGVWRTECRREAIFDVIQPRMAARRGWMAMDYVPVEGWHRFRIKDAAASGTNPYIHHTRFAMGDNAHNLPEGEIQYQRTLMSEEEAAVRIDGKDAAAFGVVYKQFDPERHVIPTFSPPDGWPRWRTMDYGYRNPTVCLWATAAPSGYDLPGYGPLEHGGLIVYREYFATEKTVPQNARAIEALSDGESFRGPPIIDPTTAAITQANGTSISQAFHDAGLPVRLGMRVNKYGNMRMIENVRLLFNNDQLFFTKDCTNTIFEHSVYRFKETRDGKPMPDDPILKKNDHSCDALKLLVAENPRYGTQTQAEVIDLPREWDL